MNLDLAIKGSRANLPNEGIEPTALLRELANHGFAGEDGRLALEKALMDGYVAPAGNGRLVKAPRAFEPADDGAGDEADSGRP